MINNLSLLNLLHEPVYLILVNRLHFSIDYGGRLINNRVKEKQIDVFHSNGLRDQKIEIQFFCFFSITNIYFSSSSLLFHCWKVYLVD